MLFLGRCRAQGGGPYTSLSTIVTWLSIEGLYFGEKSSRGRFLSWPEGLNYRESFDWRKSNSSLVWNILSINETTLRCSYLQIDPLCPFVSHLVFGIHLFADDWGTIKGSVKSIWCYSSGNHFETNTFCRIPLITYSIANSLLLRANISN